MSIIVRKTVKNDCTSEQAVSYLFFLFTMRWQFQNTEQAQGFCPVLNFSFIIYPSQC